MFRIRQVEANRLVRHAGRRSQLRILATAVILSLCFAAASPAAIPGSLRLAPVAGAGDPVIAAAGDVACDPSNSSFNGGNGSSSSCRMRYTSDLIVNGNYAGVIALGDNQYYCGGYSAYVQSYDLSWGRVKSITHPSVGNHEYLTSGGTGCDSTNTGAAGYFKYFGAAAGQQGQGYYSLDIGAWHLVALNSNCSSAGGCGTGSPQYNWLQADLAAHTTACTLAYWHIPLYSSGGRASSNMRTLWQVLYDNNADLVLEGHDHTYERFAPQNATAGLDTARGLRSFIVGTGGANHTSFTTVAANSEVRDASTFGILAVTLHPTSYDWQFIPEAGKTFTDSGSTSCHGIPGPPDTTPPSVPNGLAGTATSGTSVALTWNASTDNVGVASYTVFRNGSAIGTPTTTSFTDTGVSPSTTYSYAVSARDAAGNTSAWSVPVSVTTPATAGNLTFAPVADAYISDNTPTEPPDKTPPTVARPAVGLVGSTSMRKTSIPITASWTAADPGGVVAQQLERQVEGGKWSPVTLSTPSMRTVAVSARLGSRIAFRIRAKDAAGNWSAWATSAVVRPIGYNESSGLIVRRGAWVHHTSTSSWGGNYRTASRAGASVSLTFSGRGVAFVSRRSFARGTVRVYVDRTLRATVNLYGATSWRRLAYVASWSSLRIHTIRIVVVRTTGHRGVDLDGIVVLH
jgi:chitodextrinase